jgi:hypothetical protein
MTKSLSLQPSRFNPSAIIRSPLASAVSPRNSPAWIGQQPILGFEQMSKWARTGLSQTENEGIYGLTPFS